RLIDLDDLVDELDAFDPVVRPRLVARPVQRPRERLVQDVVDEGRLARSGNACNRREDAKRNLDVDVLEIVLPGAADHQLTLQSLGAPPTLRNRDRSRA